MAQYLDSAVFQNVFSTPEMRAIFDEEAFFETVLRVEAALARAEASVGVIPREAADEITEKASLEYLDVSIVEDAIARTGHPIMAIISGWKPAFGSAGEYVHWGATSQDVLDLTMMLLLREAIGIVRDDVASIGERLASLAAEHRTTPMIGRTHFVHAIPITFGLKVAVWIDELDRHLARIDRLEDHIVAQFFGATGTLASLGDVGLAVQAALGEELELPVPAVCWHSARDRYAEIVSTVAMTMTTLAKIAARILFAHRPEVHEFREQPGEGHIGSSTMPHKRNPKRSELTVALARLVRSQSSVMTEIMQTVDERDATTWYCEFAIVPNTFLYSSRILENMKAVLSTLEVYPARMAEHLERYGALIASERVMMALAQSVGRQTAHDIVTEAAEAALEGESSFESALRSDDRVRSAVGPDGIDSLLASGPDVGLAARFVDRVLAGRG